MQPRLVTYRRAGQGIARMAWVLRNDQGSTALLELGSRQHRVLTCAEERTVTDYREPRIVAPASVRAMVHP